MSWFELEGGVYRHEHHVRAPGPSFASILGSPTFTTENRLTVSFRLHLETTGANEKYRVRLKRLDGTETIVGLGDGSGLQIAGPL